MADAEQQESTKGSTRRQALKAGVAAGVGLAAWSGPTITSIGGTPAYAQTCTNFTVNTTSSDRNSDSSGGCAAPARRFKPQNTALPSGYSYSPPFFSEPGYCNTARFTTNLVFPAGIECRVRIAVHQNGLFDSGPWNFNRTFTGTSPLEIFLPAASEYTPGVPVNDNTKWSIRVQCSNVPGCF